MYSRCVHTDDRMPLPRCDADHNSEEVCQSALLDFLLQKSVHLATLAGHRTGVQRDTAVQWHATDLGTDRFRIGQKGEDNLGHCISYYYHSLFCNNSLVSACAYVFKFSTRNYTRIRSRSCNNDKFFLNNFGVFVMAESCEATAGSSGDADALLIIDEELQGTLSCTLNIGQQLDERKKQIDENLAQTTRHQDALLALKERQNEMENAVMGELPDRLVRLEKSRLELKTTQWTDKLQLKAAAEKQKADVAELEAFLQCTRGVSELRNYGDPAVRARIPPVILVMDGFEERKANNDRWSSQAFYSHTYGYKICLQVFPNGRREGYGSHVSVYVSILPGEFDVFLTWPFCGYVTIRVVNSKNKKRSNFQIRVELNSEASLHLRQRQNPLAMLDPANCGFWGVDKVLPHHKLKAEWWLSDTQFVVKNSLTFCVTKVDTFNLHH